MKRWILPGIAVIGLLVLMIWMADGFGPKIEPGAAAGVKVPFADGVVVEPETVVLYEAVPGTVSARDATIVSSRLLARVSKVLVRAGDIVEAGDVLVQLESADLEARVNRSRSQAEAVSVRVVEAKRNLERAVELQQRKLVAEIQVDSARADASSLEAEYQSAKQALEEAQTALSFATVSAPIGGRIVDRFVEPGDLASPGVPLLSLYNPGAMRVEAQVREERALELTLGQTLMVDLPALSRRVNGTVDEIVPAADAAARSFLVKISLPAAMDLRPGMYARVTVPAGTVERILVPADQVVEVGQLDLIHVGTANGVERRFVRLGRVHEDGRVEILAGLESGELVVSAGGAER